MKVPRGRTLLVAFSSVVAVFCAVLLVGPKSLGGPVSVLAVSGNSMEPRINSGDLIFVRSGGPYHVGEIVAYHNVPAAATFLHRIIRTRRTGFVMKGDHNGWIDPGTAQPSQVVGSLWIRIPHAGSAFRWVASPFHGALLAALAAFLIGLRETLRRKRRRRQGSGGGRPAPDEAPVWAASGDDRLGNVAPGPWTPRPPPRWWELQTDTILKATLAAALIGVAACAFLGIVAFSRPTSISGQPAPLFRQSGTLAYEASAPPSPVYPTGRVTSPAPVYLHIVNSATFSFLYRLVPFGRSAVSGEAQLSLVLHGNTGWTRVLTSSPLQPFHGTTLRLHETVSIARIRNLLATVESLTASPDSYSLAVEPLVVTHGSEAGQPFAHRFAPQFTFDLTDAEMTLAGAPPTAQAAAAALHSSTLVTTTPPGPQDSTLAIGLLRLPVGWWRTIALVLGAVMFAVGAGAFVAMQRRLALQGEAAQISARHRDLLVPLAGSPSDNDRRVVVRSFDDLVRVARRHETTILHHTASDRAEQYLVLADGVTFVYRSSSIPEAHDAAPEERTSA